MKGDGVAEGLQAGDEAAGQAFGVAALVVVAAEFAVGLAGGEHVPVGDEHRVLDGAERAAVPEAGLEALVLGLEVAAFGAGGGQRGLLQRDAEELAAVASASGVAFAGGLVVAWAASGPGGEVPAVGKTLMSVPISATIVSAVRWATPVIVAASLTAACPVGPSSASIASDSWAMCSSRKSRCDRIAPMISAWWASKRP